MSTFIWYDLMTPDMKASADFYAHVVGWTIADSGMPGMNYAILKAGGVDVGGMMPVPPSASPMPPCWNGYIHSTDVDKDAKRAVALGGAIFQEAMDIPGVGRFAVLSDTSKAAFIIFTPGSSESPAKVADGTPGHIGWRELMSGDWQKAWAFLCQHVWLDQRRRHGHGAHGHLPDVQVWRTTDRRHDDQDCR